MNNRCCKKDCLQPIKSYFFEISLCDTYGNSWKRIRICKECILKNDKLIHELLKHTIYGTTKFIDSLSTIELSQLKKDFPIKRKRSNMDKEVKKLLRKSFLKS